MTEISPQERVVKVSVEYCNSCDYASKCLALGNAIRKVAPNAVIEFKTGRQGSFEVTLQNKLIYSKLKTMALPDFDEVASCVRQVAQGKDPVEIKSQQPIDCVVM